MKSLVGEIGSMYIRALRSKGALVVISCLSFYFWVLIPAASMIVGLLRGPHAAETIRASLTFFQPVDPFLGEPDKMPSDVFGYFKYFGNAGIELVAFLVSCSLCCLISDHFKALGRGLLYLAILCAISIFAAVVRQNPFGAVFPFAAGLSGILVGDFYNRSRHRTPDAA